jgi:hypothetical protein
MAAGSMCAGQGQRDEYFAGAASPREIALIAGLPQLDPAGAIQTGAQ